MAFPWKKIGTGVAMGLIAGGIAGGVHYMFLAPQFAAQPDFFGIPMATLLPILLGAGLFTAGYIFKAKGMTADILKYAGVSACAFGVATYANWITPTVQVGARARAYVPARRVATPVRRATAAVYGTKII